METYKIYNKYLKIALTLIAISVILGIVILFCFTNISSILYTILVIIYVIISCLIYIKYNQELNKIRRKET